MYKPLPECLAIKESDIHGMGIFATRNLYPGIDLGIAHIKLEGFPQEHCRTPLGGFYNHSDDPNCKLIAGTDIIHHDYVKYWPEPKIKEATSFFLVKRLFTIKNIQRGEEITCSYTLYELEAD